MALINCKECGKEISDQAKFCPNCGFPIKKKGNGFAVASLVLGIFGCMYALPMVSGVVDSTMQASEKIAISVYIMIFGVLALIFGLVSHIKGCKLKKKTAGIILGAISTISSLISIIFLLV